MIRKRILTLLAGLLLMVPVLAWAQPDPRDSIILECKDFAPNLTDTSLNTPIRLRVYITNKDSLTFLTLALREVTTVGTAYANLSTPRSFAGIINTLTNGLKYSAIGNAGAAVYNNSSPDSFLVAAGFDAGGEDPPSTIEPPHATRTPVWEIRFEHTSDSLGTVTFDSCRLIQSTGFTNTVPRDVKVNFVRGCITLDIPIVDNPPPGPVNAGPNGCAEYDFNSAGCSGPWTIVNGPPGATINPATGQFSLCDQCGGDYPVTIGNTCAGQNKTFTFTAHFNPGPPNAICPPSAQVQAGSAYNANASATLGVPPYTFSLVSGPAGLTVSAAGAISWSPGDADVGSHQVCIRVIDRCQQTAECCYTVRVVKGGPFRICIDTIRAINGQDVEVSIRNLADATDPLLANGKDVGGFSFLLSYDCTCLQFLSARKGAFLSDHRWEFFTYRYGAVGNGNCGAGCPSCLIRVVAIADVNNGTAHPLFDRTNVGEWVVLKFRTSTDRTLAGQCCAISWYWFDCNDNTVSDSTGNQLWVADSLYSSSGALVNLATEFPAVNVANCDQFSGGEGKPSPRKNIIFCNGAICLKTTREIDDRGDINQNGAVNEIADAVLYENYFIYGSSVFSSDPNRRQGQIAASDVNADGNVLTVADLVLLLRIITGDANPYPRMNPVEGAVTIGLSGSGSDLTVSAASASDLGGLYLKLRVEGTAEVALAGAASGMSLKANQIGNELSVLIYSEAKGQLIAPNAGAVLSLRLDGSAELLESDAADYYGVKLPTLTKVSALPTAFKLSQNYPNPFNGKTSLSLALPVASDFEVTVYNVTGQVVKTISGSGAGVKTIVWDGTDSRGAAVSSGIYFFKAVAGSYSAVVKGLYLK